MKHRHLAAGTVLAFALAASQAAPVDLPSRLHGVNADPADRSEFGGGVESTDTLSFASAASDDRAVLNHFALIDTRPGHGNEMNPFRPGRWNSHAWHHGHAQPVPEPGTVALWLAGLGVVGFLGVRRKLDR